MIGTYIRHHRIIVASRKAAAAPSVMAGPIGASLAPPT